ncbi:MAG TPA: hypothetical protein VLI55_12235, partial [Bryobacteraceae bacterium]|nr:hypothetical protein [Bryobacteraceae bacterium]
VWTSMKNGGWIQESVPSAAHPLTNGDFSTPFYGHGFDWIRANAAGVEVDQFPGTEGVRVAFAGEQAEQCVLLRQYILVEPGREYRMTWKATGDQMGRPSGLTWHVQSAGARNSAEIASGDVLADSEGVWEFKAPGVGRLCLLTLEYRRLPGTVLARGSLNLQAVSIVER